MYSFPYPAYPDISGTNVSLGNKNVCIFGYSDMYYKYKFMFINKTLYITGLTG